MPSERVQRQIDRLLDQAEAAVEARDWSRVRDLTQDVLRLDPDNTDARSFLDAASRDAGGQTRADAPAAPNAAPPTSDLESPASSASPPLPASFASGRYLVRRFLGEGGKKRVYLAHDTKLDRDVAFALIKTDGLDADGLVRVRREAQAMGRLGDHAHIVTVFDAGDEQGVPYIVSQFRGGGAVEDALAHAEQHRLPPERAMRIAEQVCLALQHAHDRGIIHRDLKSANIWLSDDGAAALGDFGLAVAIDRSRMTMAGMMVGTVAYMAPEQALGRTPDARSDLYALGAMLYEMVTGRPPFLGDDAVGVISQHINTAPVAPSWHNPEVPKPLEALVLRLLAKSPDERPASADDVARELRRILERSTVSQHPQQELETITDLRGLAWGRFVGRREEMEQLKASLEDALSGKGSLAMVVGEPGIGKTRLAEEFAVYAGLRGAQVLTGRCYEGESAIPYRPFVEAFRQYVRARPDTALRSELGAGAPEVATLVTDVRERFPDIEPAPALEAEAQRLRLFDSITQFLRNASAAAPLVLHLDDIHWADKPSLLLLQHIARNTGAERLLIVGAYRDVELDRTHPLSEALGTLRRLPNYSRVLLRGLPEDTVAEFLQAIEPSEEAAPGRVALAVALHRETEGNPLFIREVLSHLIEEGKLIREGGRWTSRVTSVSELGIPEGVREVIGRRLSHVSDACNRVLTRASTMTRGFTWEALQAISDAPEAELLDLLDEALAAQLIAERKGDLAGTYDFTHALIRQTLYEELSTPRRVLLHRQVGEALERLYATSIEPHLAELAHHFYQAAPGGDVEKAIGYARRAGDHATELLAYEDAAGHYERALQALDLRGGGEARLRYELTSALAAAYFRSDMPDQSVPAAEQAVTLAETLGDANTFARAAIAYAEAVGRGPLVGSGRAVAVLEGALQRIAQEPSGLRALLVAQLSLDRVGLTPDERLSMAREAESIADAAGDETIRARVLDAIYVALSRLGPNRAEERLAVTRAWVEAAEGAQDQPQRLFAGIMHITALAELGEMRQALDKLPALWDLADGMREPAYSGWRPMWGCMQALMEGRYADAEPLAIQALQLAQRVRHPFYLQSAAGLFYDLRRGQGRLSELEQIVLPNVDDALTWAVWRAGLAFLYEESGRREPAREWFERLAANDFTDVPEDSSYLTVLFLASELCRRLGDERRAPILYDLLEPWAERNIVAGNCVLVLGSASRPLGELAATMRRWDDAQRHFEYALAFDEKIGAHPWLARTQHEYATMLRDRDAPGDREHAQDLNDKALATFDRLGMKRDLERALALKLELQGALSSSLYTSIDAVARAVRDERPALPQQAVAPDGTVTIMFSDIEDSTTITERLGDQRWQEVLRAHNAIIREQIAAHTGFEVKTMGDGFMVAFQSARRALDCAVAIQRAFAANNGRLAPAAGEGTDVMVRIGLHAGEAVRDADDFYGKNVIMASRVAGSARGGEIVVSSLLKQLTDSTTDLRFGAPREVQLKGLSGVHVVHRVLWGPA